LVPPYFYLCALLEDEKVLASLLPEKYSQNRNFNTATVLT
jgi:hypothetical protein